MECGKQLEATISVHPLKNYKLGSMSLFTVKDSGRKFSPHSDVREGDTGEACKMDRKNKNAVVLERVGEGRIMLKLMKRKRNWLSNWLRRN